MLATTDEYCLLTPLLDRARLLLRLDFYSDEELSTLLRQRSGGLDWRVEGDVLLLIAQRSRRTPRLGQACRQVCRAEGRATVTVVDLERACLLEGIDALGLGPTERQYLRAVVLRHKSRHPACRRHRPGGCSCRQLLDQELGIGPGAQIPLARKDSRVPIGI